jgi:translation initiation factor IF-2
VLELRANPSAPASGVVLEARMEKGLGTVATTLIQRGTLRPGDDFVAGEAFGKVGKVALGKAGTHPLAFYRDTCVLSLRRHL